MSADTATPRFDRDMTGASDEQLLKVVELIDTMDRRGKLDHLLEPVRDRLALLRPARPLTLGRVLTLPFEDLLVAEDEAWPGRRCFPRSRVARLVIQVVDALPAPTLARLRSLAEGHSMLAGDAVRAIGDSLWPAAAEMVANGLANGDLEPGEHEQLAGLVPLLALGPTLVPTLWELPPRPMRPLTRPLVDRLLGAVRSAVPLGEIAVQSMLEVMLVRSASPLVVLEPLRAAELGLSARAREEAIAQLVRRRIRDMREIAARLASPSTAGGSGAAAAIRLAADLDTLEGKWPVAAEDRAALREIRGSASAFVGAGIDKAVREELLTSLDALAQPGGPDDDGVERLEETARHTRRLGIAGAKLGLAASADAMLDRFLPTFQEAILRRGQSATAKTGLLDQVRIVEILFGADAAMRLYDEVRGRASLN